MPRYEITAPDGRKFEVTAPEGASQSEVLAYAQANFAQAKAPETTVLGNVKEAFKGLVPGAVGLLESAATGASALLPEDMEKSAREKIKSVAGAAKAPFAAAPGYEESVTRKLSEAVGSTAPFLLAGPFGLAGRAAAVGLGVGAGAGESRTRAEEAGATGDQRSTATALGIIPGALEAFAPIRILSRIPTASKAAGVEAVKRAMVAGGEEAAQEAASGFAQNLIAKGVYKPEQALIEGLGEQAAYGGATGAIVQGLMDLALGRRARGAQTTPAAPETQPGPQLTPETPAEAPAEAPPLQLGATPPFVPRALPDGSVAATQAELDAYEEQKFADKYAPQSVRPPEQLVVPGTEELQPSGQTDLFGKPLEPAADDAEPRAGDLLDGVPLTTEVLRDADMAPSAAEARSAGQQTLNLRRTPEGQPTTSGQPEPTITSADIMMTAIPVPKGVEGWLLKNVVGGTRTQLDALIAKDPTLVQGSTARAKILRSLTAPDVPAFEETPRVEPTPTPPTAVEPRAEPRAGEPSVGVPSEPTPAEPVEPGAGVPPTAAAPVAPDGRGLVSAGRPAVQGDETAVGKPAAVKTDRQQRIEFGKRLGAAQSYPGSLQGRTNKPAQAAAKRGDFQGVVAALENSKNATVAEVARRAKSLGTKIEIDDTAGETYEGRSQFQDQMSIDGAKMHLEALEKLREFAPQVAKLRPGAPLPANIPSAEVSAISNGEPQVLPLRLRNFAENSHSMFNPLGLPNGATLRTKEDFDALLGAFERVTETVGEQALRLTSTASAMQQGIAGAYDAGTDTIRVPEYFSKDETVLAHEIVHAQAVKAVANPTPAQRPAVQRLNKLYEHVKADMERRGKTDAFFRMPYGVTNVQEFIAEGMANPTFQYMLSRIKYKNLTAWDKFTEGLANLLGIKNDNAFTELLTVYGEITEAPTPRTKKAKAPAVAEPKAAPVAEKTLQEKLQAIIDDPAASKRAKQTAFKALDSLTDPDMNETAEDRQQNEAYAEKELQSAEKQRGPMFYSIAPTELPKTQAEATQLFSVAPSTESLIDSMGPLEAQEKSMLRKVIDGFKDQTEVGYAVKFRTQTADSAATIEHRLRNDFDGAVRDKLGKFNPMGLYRQAQDYSKMLLEYMQVGAIAKEPATGLWKVKADPKVRPPVEVYSLIDKWAAKNGYSRERGTQIASRILEGVRLDAMRTSNKNDGTSFLLHLKDNEIDQLVREYKADPDLQAMSKAMDEARLAMVDNMVKVGRLSAEQGQVWKDAAGYVPFDRIEDFATSFSKIKKVSNKGLAQVGKLPELVGSINRPVGNVFDNYLNTLGWMVGQTIKTDGTVRTLRSLEDAGHAKYLGRSPQGKDNTVGMYVKGEMMYWELPSKYDVLAFKDLNPPKAKWLQVLGGASNILRKAVTVLPPFALKQVTDDVQRAIMTSGVKNPGALLRMTLSNFGGLALAELRGIQHPTVKQFGALGLTGEYDFQQGKPATSVLKDLGFKPRGKFETLIHRLDGITRASDLAVRKAIYDQSMKETNDELLSQTRAREFINFRRRGASDFVGAMVTTIPFFNAYIQGMDVLYRAASGKDSSSSVGRAQARRMFWSRAVIAMTLSSLYAIGKGDDDEDYNEMDLRTRDSNWILPGGFKLPVPGELGALFKVIPERVVEYMRRQGTPEEQEAWEATRTALSYIFEQYVGRVVPVPQGVKPLLEAWTNYSFFTGRELEGIYQKQQDPSLRRASNTSELAIAIAEFSKDVIGVDKVSPIMIDNALNGYFGSTAGLLVAVTDSLLNPTRVDRPLHKYALISNYMYDPVGTRRMTEFYEAREKVGRANTTLNELMKTDLDKAAAYAEANADQLMLESAVNSTLEQLERTRAYKKHLNSKLAAEDMTSDERAEQIKEVRQMEVELTSWLREAKASLRQ